mmetsp:Transcript_6326/g.13979  ORF Transcript_6326/g.13979 Transcript_6326/m.13979 type:complete len:643 (+) Transcript_6326:35-1963(+)
MASDVSLFAPSLLSLLNLKASASIISEQSTLTDPAQPTLPEISQHASSVKPPRTWNESGATCIACGIGISLPGFDTAEEQRAHFKTDWHRLNVKRRVHGQPSLAEDKFEEMLDADEVSSISGSEASGEDDDFEEEEEGEQHGRAEAAGPVRGRHKGVKAGPLELPRVVFKTQDERHLAVWKCVLYQDHGKATSSPPTHEQLLDSLQRCAKSQAPWVVVLLRGGHFAAAVLKPRAVPSSSAKGDVPEPFEVVAHKTFHRYVVRAKAGGKQSSKDATGKYARSAGSQLRRYNEAALDADISELMSSWAQHLRAAELVFVHAPSSNLKSIFYEGGPLTAGSPCVRRIPFVTQRPTFSEVKRVARILATAYDVSADVKAAELRRRQEEEEAASREAAEVGPSGGAGASVGSSRRTAAQQETAAASSSEGEEDEQAAQSKQASTQLHKAAKAGDAARVTKLLESGHDPSARDASGRTPYEVSQDKAVRDAFRRYMAAAPDRWDYSSARIPSPLTDDMEAAQQAKKAEKKAQQKAKEKERKTASEAKKKAAAVCVEDEIARAAAEAAALAARLGNMRTEPGGKVGGAGSSRAGAGPAGKTGNSGKGRGGAQPAAPTPEELAKRREMIAAAAEARMRALQQQSEQQKLW